MAVNENDSRAVKRQRGRFCVSAGKIFSSALGLASAGAAVDDGVVAGEGGSFVA